MGSWHRTRRALGGVAALALVTLTGACDHGPPSDDSAELPADLSSDPAAGHTDAHADAAVADAALASVHRELPPPPSVVDDRVTVVVTHAGGVRDPGLDAAVAALRQRPDIHVVVVAPDRGDPTSATTMSGDPARIVPGDVADTVRAVAASPGMDADLVVIGVDVTGGPGDERSASAARAAVGGGIPALLVSVEGADGADYAAATMQLLEVLDFGLADIVESEPRALRLTVPSCREGTLRGRVEVGAVTDDSPPEVASDCLAVAPAPGAGEDETFAAGYATLADLG